MDALRWAGEHPFLSVTLVWLIVSALSRGPMFQLTIVSPEKDEAEE